MPQPIEELVRRINPSARQVTVVEDGTTSTVGIAGNKVYLFPHTAEHRAAQLYEAELLRHISGHTSLAVPQLLDIIEEPACIVLSFIPGRHLTYEQLRQLSDNQLRLVVRQLIHFSLELGECLTPEELGQLEDRYLGATMAQERRWPDYLATYLRDISLPGSPQLEDLAHDQYARWLTMYQNDSTPQIIVHDDLHTGNILFADGKISGILDFGDATIGTITQELRQLYRIDERAVKFGIEEYAAHTGVKLQAQDLRTWAITHELATYCRWLSLGELNRPSLLRAERNLKNWLPEFIAAIAVRPVSA